MYTYSGRQSATTYWNEHSIHGGQIFQYFYRDCALALDNFFIIEGRYKGHFVLFRIFQCRFLAVIECITRQYNFNMTIAPHFGLRNLLARGGAGHENNTPNAYLFTG